MYYGPHNLPKHIKEGGIVYRVKADLIPTKGAVLKEGNTLKERIDGWFQACDGDKRLSFALSPNIVEEIKEYLI